MWYVVAMGFAALLGAIAQVLFKKGMATGKVVTFVLAAGIALYGVAFLINMWVYRAGADASRAYPLIALSYVWLPLLAAVFLGEQLTAGKLVGGVIILVGVVVASVW
jgi:drug/metabolite transporter (DMT)-like permease